MNERELIRKVNDGELDTEAAIRILAAWARKKDAKSRHKEVLVEEIRAEADPISSSTLTPKLLRLIARLPERQKQCVWLQFQGGLKQAEIAEALGMTQANVSAHLQNARANLADLLAEEDYRALMADSIGSKFSGGRPMLFPYELWSRYYDGCYRAGNGMWVRKISDRLADYIMDRFGPGVEKPSKY